MKRIFQKGVNVVIDDQNNSNLDYIPKRASRMDLGANYISVRDVEKNSTYILEIGDAAREDGSIFDTVEEMADELSEFVGGFNTGSGGSGPGNGTSYEPTVVVDTSFPSVVSVSSTNEITIRGDFLDYLQSATVSAGDETGVSASIISATFSELVLELVVNSVEQFYTVNLNAPNQTIPLLIEASDFQTVIPTTTGSAPNLWVKTGNNNAAVVGTGTFRAENNTGDGWNEHAYFGPLTSSSRIEVEMTIDFLNGNSNAYCFTSFSSLNAPSTGGQPRIYVFNGVGMQVYSPTGQQQTLPNVAVGDIIQVVLEPNKMEVFVNGQSRYTFNGTVQMNNVYVNYTAFRIMGYTNINAKVY